MEQSNIKGHIMFNPKSKTIFFFLFIWLNIFISTSVLATTYYVDATNGADDYDGLTDFSAWKSIAKVNASRFNPGDHILFKRGEVWREQLTVPSSGTPNDMVVFGSYGAGEKPIISGSNVITHWSIDSGLIYWISLDWICKQLFQDGKRLERKEDKSELVMGSWYQDPLTKTLFIITQDGTNPSQFLIEAAKRSYGIYLHGKSYILIDGLAIKQTNDKGAIFIDHNSNGNIVTNCEVFYSYGIGMFIDYYSNNNRLLNNKVSFSHYAEGNYQFYASNGIMVRDSSNGNTLSGNECFSNYGSGVFITNASNNLIEKNRIYDNGAGGIDINDSQSNNNLVKDNVVYRNGLIDTDEQGISFFNAGIGNVARGNVVSEQKGGPDDGAGISIDTTANQVIVEKNIVFNNVGHGLIIWNSKNGVFRNNTSYANGKAGIYVGGKDSPSSQIINNIAMNNTAFQFVLNPETADAGGHVVSNNNFFKAGDQSPIYFNIKSYSALDFKSAFPGSVTYQVDPVFVSPPQDFALSSSSPCIDKGVDVGLPFTGANPDIGAKEFGEKSINLSPPRNFKLLQGVQ